MRFLTMDMELGDRMLPTICSLTIVSWLDDKPNGCFHTLLNPESDIEEFFDNRHGFTNYDLNDMPNLRDKWIRIYDILSNKMVFIHNANEVVTALCKRAGIDFLNMPNFTFGDTTSIARRCFKGLEDYRLPNVTEKLQISNQHNNSYIDAHSVGILLNRAVKETQCEDYIELYKKVGYAGGKIINGHKQLYRAVKDKKEGIYVAKKFDYATKLDYNSNIAEDEQ